MPSAGANNIIAKLSRVLCRSLTVEEIMMCEDLAYNVFNKAVVRYIDRASKLKSLKFATIYVPVMNGIIVGAMRTDRLNRFKFDDKKKCDIYAAVHMHIGDGFPSGQLDDIVWMTKECTLKEVQQAIQAAAYHGVRHAGYVKSVIVGNRRRAAAMLRARNAKYKKITDDPPDVNIGVPNVKDIQDAWARKLKAAIDRGEVKRAEDDAEKKIQI